MRLGTYLSATALLSLALTSPATARTTDATVTVDAPRAKSTVVTRAAGGSVTVNAKDGTRITVRIPKDAVAENTTITATPVRKLASRATRRGLVAGVQLAPEGLALARAGTVTFAPKRRLPAKRQLFLGSGGTGAGVYVMLPELRRGKARGKRVLRPSGRAIVPIYHFSTVNAFDYSKASLKEINDIRFPKAALAQIEHRLGKILSEERIRQLLGMTDDPDAVLALEEMRTAFDESYKKIIEPALAAAGMRLATNCTRANVVAAQETITLALGAARQAQLLGLDISAAEAFFDGAEILVKGGRCLSEKCAELNDPRIGSFLLSISRQAQLIGLSEISAALDQNAEACSEVTVLLDTTIDFAGGDAGTFVLRVVGRAPFNLLPLSSVLVGAQPPRRPGVLEYTRATGGVPNPGCPPTSVTGTTAGEFAVEQLRLPGFVTGPVGGPLVEELRLAIDRSPTEMVTFPPAGEDCPSLTITTNFWLAGFLLHYPGPPVFPGTLFGPGAPPTSPYAEAFVIGRVAAIPGGGTATETTNVQILNTPLPRVPVPDPNPPKPPARG